jgi:hypothetical protein
VIPANLPLLFCNGGVPPLPEEQVVAFRPNSSLDERIIAVSKLSISSKAQPLFGPLNTIFYIYSLDKDGWCI